MNKRDAFRRVLKREEKETDARIFPPDIDLTPPKLDEFTQMKTGQTVEEYFGLFHKTVQVQMEKTYQADGKYLFANQNMPEEYEVDAFGTGESRGSEACMHMVHFHSPLTGECSLEQIENHPLPEIAGGEKERLQKDIKEIHGKGLAVRAWLEQTIWERSWLIRGMENLMMDMMLDDPMAERLLERICEHSCRTAAFLAEAGVDLIALGDDVGMQSTPLMDPKLWLRYIQPKLARVIASAKKVNPEVIISYHSCGFATPFIDHLIDAGVEVLNPIQPESMDVEEVYNKYSDRIAFWGSIGTQTTMPFGTAEEVRHTVMERVRISEKKRGYLISPTHVIEPEVPWDNLHAYIDVMKELNRR
ncbi:MAG: hypothetical protein B6241_11710 [Spirochaetaceae bacterium 4572_59]|nr:MAG: hypothetical protein B6241_11710 [Spirochaetaceae bacterium 4572_59]